MITTRHGFSLISGFTKIRSPPDLPLMTQRNGCSLFNLVSNKELVGLESIPWNGYINDHPKNDGKSDV